MTTPRKPGGIKPAAPPKPKPAYTPMQPVGQTKTGGRTGGTTVNKAVSIKVPSTVPGVKKSQKGMNLGPKGRRAV